MEANCHCKSFERAQCVCDPPYGGGWGGSEYCGKAPAADRLFREQAHALANVPVSQIESRCVCYRQGSCREKKMRGGWGGGEKRWGG